MRTPLPSQDELNCLFLYDPDRGALIRKQSSRARRGRAGEFAGSTQRMDGYVKVSIRCRYYAAHRLIWVMANGDGSIPTGFDIDHKNGNRSDNRLQNLRLATASQNTANFHTWRNPATGVRGVYIVKRGRKPYCAQVCVRGRKVFCSYFSTLEEAAAARRVAAVKAYGEFTCAA